MRRHVHDGPGLAKCGGAHPFARRVLNLVRCADPLWSQWLERLDVVSEGMAEGEGALQIYRGTTSMIVLTDRFGGSLPAEALDSAAQAAMRDPHFCVRAMRIARREAASRSPGPLDSVHVELQISVDPRGIRVDIDVEGRVLGGRRLVKTKC